MRLICLFLSLSFLISCNQVKEKIQNHKEDEMRKDALSIIKMSQESGSFTFFTDYESVNRAFEAKYPGEDMILFRKILREEIKLVEKEGGNVGPIGLMYIFDF